MSKKQKIQMVSVLLIMLLLFINLTSCQIQLQRSDPTNTKYVLETRRCGSLFGIGPKAVIASIDNAVYPYNQYVSYSLDENDSLVIILSEEQRKLWLDYHKGKLQNLLDIIDSQGEQFVEINEDYTKIVYSIDGSEEAKLSFSMRYVQLMSYCGFIVMLEGNDINEWEMDSTILNFETGEVIWHIIWPTEVPSSSQD